MNNTLFCSLGLCFWFIFSLREKHVSNKSSTDFLNYPKGITFKDTHIRGKKRRSEGDYPSPVGPVVKTLHRTYIHTYTHTHTRTKGTSRGWGGCYLQTIYKGVSRFYSVSGGKIAAENDQAILRDWWLLMRNIKTPM